MKSYIKTIEDGYILNIQTIDIPNMGNITKQEYDTIYEVIQNRPTPREGYNYRLKTDLTWEEYEEEDIPIEDEIDDSEALEIIVGGV